MVRKILLIIFVGITLLINKTKANDLKVSSQEEYVNILSEANKLYQESKYEEAGVKYQSLVNLGLKDKNVYYNLGNSYYKSKNIGLAILNFKRALKISPRDNDIKINLEFARGKVIDQIKNEKPGMMILLDNIISLLTVNEWIILCAIFYFILMAILIYSVFYISVSHWVNIAKTITIVFFIIILLFSLSSYWINHRIEAVVVAKEAEARNGPGANYSTGFVIHEGAEVYIENESEGWVEILLSNGLMGWIEKNSLHII